MNRLRWLMTRLRYRRHGLRLGRRPDDEVWHFAYGSNMNETVFCTRRGMRPRAWRVGRVKGYRLRFNLEGRPRGRAAPANIAPDPAAEVWGVLYQITGADVVRLDGSEGVPGRRYRHLSLTAEDAQGTPIPCFTYIAEGKATDGRPSLRYLTLIREGARAHGLPPAYLEFLDEVRPAE